ncbi:MAG: hypothetical protein MUP04_08255 [Anaerolineae bacterium]|nr:hypothetical protein [Anaerolineae bacterium]
MCVFRPFRPSGEHRILQKGLYLIHFHTAESSHDIKARIVREKDVERIWVPVYAEIEEQSLIPSSLA